MATLTELKKAFAETIAAHGELGDVWIYDNMEERFDLPAIVIDVSPETSADFEVAFGGAQDNWEFYIYILVTRSAGSGDGARELDTYLEREGPRSIRQAIYENETLGLEDTTATAYAVAGYGGRFEIGKVDHIGAWLKVRVNTDGRQD